MVVLKMFDIWCQKVLKILDITHHHFSLLFIGFIKKINCCSICFLRLWHAWGGLGSHEPLPAMCCCFIGCLGMVEEGFFVLCVGGSSVLLGKKGSIWQAAIFCGVDKFCLLRGWRLQWLLYGVFRSFCF